MLTITPRGEHANHYTANMVHKNVKYVSVGKVLSVSPTTLHSANIISAHRIQNSLLRKVFADIQKSFHSANIISVHRM